MDRDNHGGGMTRRRMISTLGSAVVAGGTATVLGQRAFAEQEEAGVRDWEIRSAATAGGTTLAVVQSAEETGIAQLDFSRTGEVRRVRILERPYPETFFPHVVFNLAGRVVVGGSEEVLLEPVSISPDLPIMLEADPAALDTLSAWELTTFEELTSATAVVPVVVDALSGAPLALDLGTAGERYAEVIDGKSSGTPGAADVLVAGGGRAEEITYAEQVRLLHVTDDLAVREESLIERLGESGPHFIASVAESSVVVTTSQRGDVTAHLDDRDETVATGSLGTGVFESGDRVQILTSSDGGVLSHVTLEKSPSGAVTQTVSPPSDAVAAAESGNRVIRIDGSPGEVIAGTPATGYRLIRA